MKKSFASLAVGVRLLALTLSPAALLAAGPETATGTETATGATSGAASGSTSTAQELLAAQMADPDAPLPVPEGRVILTVTGAITRSNRAAPAGDGAGNAGAAGPAAELDLAMLQALGESEIVTDTIWTKGVGHFTGVLLKTVLDALGAEGRAIEAVAINDYRVQIPMNDATEDGPILAYALDGNLMSRRDKGPLWVIYPYASSSDYRTEVIYSRSIWQLDRMTIGK